MTAATIIALYLCFLIALPFLASLVWALALAVLVFPVYKRIERGINNPNLAAGLTTILVAVIIVVPVVVVTRQVAREIWRNAEYVRQEIQSGSWREQIEKNRFAARGLQWIENEVDLRGMAEQAANSVPGILSTFLSSSIWILFQLVVMFFALFFFFRDHDSILKSVRRLIPLSNRETEIIFRRVEDTLYATVFGEILIALIQGVLGGLIFWFLGLPAPVMWGFVIAVAAFLPVIGTWMVWTPAAVYLFMQGEVISGFILLGWGILVIMMLTSFLYPIIVGNRLHLHTLLVFIALLGGIMTFGTVGIILGPMVIALTISLIDIWRKRIDKDEDAVAEAQL